MANEFESAIRASKTFDDLKEAVIKFSSNYEELIDRVDDLEKDMDDLEKKVEGW